MSHLISLSNIQKAFGPKELFTDLNLSFHEKEKIAIIGRNGTGKSTLMKIISGAEQADSGLVAKKKNLTLEYVSQDTHFKMDQTCESVFLDYIQNKSEIDDPTTFVLTHLVKNGFDDVYAPISSLSGGQKKKLDIVIKMALAPDILLLDEPTNHLDWDSIRWLEQRLKLFSGAYIVISHDRTFLNNCTEKTIEIGPAFENNHLCFSVPYTQFLTEREKYFYSQEEKFDSLSNKARRELAWLRAGVKARTTKSRSRIKEAHELFKQVEQTKSRVSSQKKKVNLEVSNTGKKSKILIRAKGISKSYDETKVLENIDFELQAKSKVAILGKNGTGKSTLVKILCNQIQPSQGTVEHAENLKVIYYDQEKKQIDGQKTIFEFLGEGSDHVIKRGEAVHVASYASQFLFSQDHFHLKIEQLSGGEKARLLLAKFLLNECDVLVLDEPTNDLDIDTLDVLESTLGDSPVALILISHDRMFIENICTSYVAINPEKSVTRYADLNQWLNVSETKPQKSESKPKEKPKKKKRLSYMAQREYDNMEQHILEQEEELRALNEKINDPDITSNSLKLTELSSEIHDKQTKIQALYDRWQELESQISD